MAVASSFFRFIFAVTSERIHDRRARWRTAHLPIERKAGHLATPEATEQRKHGAVVRLLYGRARLFNLCPLLDIAELRVFCASLEAGRVQDKGCAFAQRVLMFHLWLHSLANSGHGVCIGQRNLERGRVGGAARAPIELHRKCQRANAGRRQLIKHRAKSVRTIQLRLESCYLAAHSSLSLSLFHSAECAGGNSGRRPICSPHSDGVFNTTRKSATKSSNGDCPPRERFN